MATWEASPSVAAQAAGSASPLTGKFNDSSRGAVLNDPRPATKKPPDEGGSAVDQVDAVE